MTKVVTLLVDESRLSPEMSLNIYQMLLTWSAQRGSRFEITLQRSAYETADDYKIVRALGVARSSPKLTSDELQILGEPGSDFVQALTSKQAPPGAIAGDNSPVEDVVIFANDRRLYGSYDYGRTQLLTLTDQEAEDIRAMLRGRGVGPDLLVLAPGQPLDPDSS